MTQENRISLNISAEDIEKIETATKTIQDTLMPHLVTLSRDERIGLTKMGDKNIAFIQKCKEFIEQNPKLKPQYINAEEMSTDIKAVETLRQILNPIEQIATALEDSIILSGSEAYVPALAYYHHVKGAMRMNVPGAKDINDELKKQFVKKLRRKKTNNSDSNES